MAVALLKEPPLTLPTELGPYRCADYDALPDEPRCELIETSEAMVRIAMIRLMIRRWRLHDFRDTL